VTDLYYLPAPPLPTDDNVEAFLRDRYPECFETQEDGRCAIELEASWRLMRRNRSDRWSHLQEACGHLVDAFVFRERTLVGHEYVLLRFGSATGAESWLRVERGPAEGAGFGQSGSWAALGVEGAAVRHLCSFSASKSTLRGATDQAIASFAGLAPILSFPCVLKHFHWLAGTEYRLFTDK
jgi:hypothetical protein